MAGAGLALEVNAYPMIIQLDVNTSWQIWNGWYFDKWFLCNFL